VSGKITLRRRTRCAYKIATLTAASPAAANRALRSARSGRERFFRGGGLVGQSAADAPALASELTHAIE